MRDDGRLPAGLPPSLGMISRSYSQHRPCTTTVTKCTRAPRSSPPWKFGHRRNRAPPFLPPANEREPREGIWPRSDHEDRHWGASRLPSNCARLRLLCPRDPPVARSPCRGVRPIKHAGLDFCAARSRRAARDMKQRDRPDLLTLHIGYIDRSHSQRNFSTGLPNQKCLY